MMMRDLGSWLIVTACPAGWGGTAEGPSVDRNATAKPHGECPWPSLRCEAEAATASSPTLRPRRGYGRFFERCRGWLNRGARLSLQSITWGNVPRDRTGFIMAQDIFPETDPPYVPDLLEASADTAASAFRTRPDAKPGRSGLRPALAECYR